MDVHNPERRLFLKTSAAVGGALLISFYLPDVARAAAQANKPAGTFAPNAWLRIGSDDSISMLIDKSEMGQGVTTALPMLLAEELEVDVTRIKTEFAPADKAYNNPIYNLQLTGGSTSVRGAWLPLRQAGAAARMLLISAAAQTWGVPSSACRAENGTVIHTGKGQRLRYGELTAKAAALPIPEEIPLKPAKDFRVIGKSVGRLDSRSKVNGTATFGIDVQMPGLLTAAIIHAPVFGGRVKSVKEVKAKSMPGVKHVVSLETAVAVVADTYWQAKQALYALEVEWEAGELAGLSSEGIRRSFIEGAKKKGKKARQEGDPQDALTRAAKTLRAEYELPYLAHATMEPMNCTAHVQKERCDVWAPTQSQAGAQEIAAQITGLAHEQVFVHTTYLGGGFGRRVEVDYVEEAVRISQAINAPVKLIWSREEDTRHDFYRPAAYAVLEAGLNETGHPIAWTHRIVTPSIMAQVLPKLAPATLPQWLPNMIKNATGRVAGLAAGLTLDDSAVEGAKHIPYAIDNLRVDWVNVDPGVPVGFWRSVGHSHNAFVVESFIDELAALAGKDPYQFRRTLLKNAPRELGVLDLAAKQAGWDKPLAKGIYRGISVHTSFGSYVAQVAEVSINGNEIKVERVVCAVDCGIVVNPDIVAMQMESGIVFGLTAALKGEITLDKGQVRQSNFHDYPMLRINEMPQVEVHILSSQESPGGVGEPGVPPIAAAVANAVYAASGKRLRRLPLRLDSADNS